MLSTLNKINLDPKATRIICLYPGDKVVGRHAAGSRAVYHTSGDRTTPSSRTSYWTAGSVHSDSEPSRIWDTEDKDLQHMCNVVTPGYRDYRLTLI